MAPSPNIARSYTPSRSPNSPSPALHPAARTATHAPCGHRLRVPAALWPPVLTILITKERRPCPPLLIVLHAKLSAFLSRQPFISDPSAVGYPKRIVHPRQILQSHLTASGMIAVYNLDNGGGPGTGALGGPPMQHNYKRAVYRAAPQAFSTEVLPPTKVGSSFAYGLRIYPITGPELPDDQSGQSSGSSGSMHTEYDVWRRWEDCLWFQEIIEEEYEQMARAKRSRLAAGKGVKKNGVYVHSDQAASFESLPPGPEAASIAKGIHEIIPKLTKKGTFFRASQSTVDQRGREFCAMIQALFADDVPTLVRELRETRLVRDFFGYWRRDKDLERKRNVRPASSPGAGAKMGVRSSSASTMSMYFSASNLSLAMAEPPPSLPRSRPHTSPSAPMPASAPPDLSASSSSTGSLSPTTPTQEIPAPMHFSVSDRGSLALAHPPSEDELQARYSIGPRSVSSKMSSLRWSRATSKQDGAALIDDLPFVFVPESQGYRDENHGGLQSLPEDQEYVPEVSGLTAAARDAPLPARRPRGNSCPERDNRNVAVYVPPSSRSQVQTQPTASRSRSRPSSPAPSTAAVVESARPESVLSDVSLRSSSGWRDSVASDLSVATEIASGMPCGAYSENGHEGTVRARSSGVYRHAARASVATMNSLMSGYSVDAVLPRRASPPPPPPIARRSQLPVGSRRPVTVKLVPREEVWCEAHEELLDAYFDEMSLRSASPVDSAYRFPREETSSRLGERTIAPSYAPKASPSPQPSLTPTVSTKSNPLNPDSITVKAILDDSIVLVRVSCSMSFLEVRARIQEKFANQEGIPLPDRFAIAYAPPVDRARYARGRARSNSASTVGSGQVQPLRYIASDEEWHTAVVGCASKLTVRIFQSRN
ncbi:uncharacterized protein LAESUDRAFT_815919 [Laetiporus sulphureus 93-53]|uniref:PX domain-containing protein n=1 Tax=Laetiporus sulphureus 93-53 TaxID=1314785 RepID=A0A165BP95_9APHY|nr:uncharacterized protein LAESUDRAFT_815919 [Laetiporus sulphureus 93-53]KZT01409.1 hypothetical protein LAESUDRAFT_815919 [Laetiporus sulphureus 93-53]